MWNLDMSRAEALDAGDGPGMGRLFRQTRLLAQMGGNHAVDDTQHLPHERQPAGKQVAQWKRETEHPLAHGLFGQRTDHTGCTAPRTLPDLYQVKMQKKEQYQAGALSNVL